MSTGLLLDGVFASEAIDSSGEILDVKGLDISDFEEGRGCANYEHKGHDEDENNGQEIVGKVVYSKKILRDSDCSNDRELMFWRKVQLPFLYGVVRLYDGAGHEGAKALAAIIRDSHANQEPIIVGFSIEGSTLDKKDNRLTRTIARRVALTLKPCNKTAISGLLADPNAPEGFEKTPVRPDLLAMVPAGPPTKKAEGGDPRFSRLGGSQMAYGPDVTKALTAGSYNAAPGNLTGGSALQVEDRTLKAQAMAAFRDWDRVTPFRKFLKHRLPEVSDEYIDHFADLVDGHVLRVKKAEEVVAELRKDGKLPKRSRQPVAKPKQAALPMDLDRLTIQGRPVPPPPQGLRRAAFDSDAGVLHTQQGSFQASVPDRLHPHLVEHIRRSGGDPAQSGAHFAAAVEQARPAHRRAMQNWFHLNRQFQAGSLSPGVVSHGVAFALLSPGVPVPMQEVMYGHLIDAMKAHGLKSFQTAAQWRKVLPDWLSRNRSGLPEHSREHYQHLLADLTTKTGAFQGFNKPNAFASNFEGYLADHHKDVQEAIRDAKGDGHIVARKLTEVRGIAPKLARYILGMLGAGNVVVPDTHFIRHFFGGRPDAPGHQVGSSPDSKTFSHLKDSLLDSADSHGILEGIDRFYGQHHAAVRHVLQDPEVGSYFQKRPDQALFPAFWLHWISIPGHEAALGIPNARHSNEDTDHAPFWSVVRPMMKKAEAEYDPNLPFHTALQHHRWVEDYGLVPALGLYYRFLAPRLMENDARMQAQKLVRKFEALGVELRKAARLQAVPAGGLSETSPPPPAEPPPPAPKTLRPETVRYKDRDVRPGRMHFDGYAGTHWAILHAGPSEFHAVPEEKLGGWDESDIVRVPRYSADAQKTYAVTRYPEDLSEKNIVDSRRHGYADFVHHDDVHSLIHGLDFGGKRWGANRNIRGGKNAYGGGSRAADSFWTKNAEGKMVFVKADPFESGRQIGEPHMEGAYHNVARDVFGLGAYLPRVGVVHEPQTGRLHAVVEGVDGHHFDEDDPEHTTALRRLGDAGELDKLALMNMVMNNVDRHDGNWLATPDGIRLIDHNVILHNYIDDDAPTYWSKDARLRGADLWGLQLHPSARDWALKLDPSELEAHLQRHGIPATSVNNARHRLEGLQSLLREDPETSRMNAFTQPQVYAGQHE